MHTDTERQIGGRRIGLRLTPRSIAPHVLAALRALGYLLEDFKEDDSISPVISPDRPGLWLVDSDRLHEIPDFEAAPNERVIIFASDLQPPSVDSRVIGEAPRPGRLSQVYAMIQRTLERTPRRCPRISTHLSARCIRENRRSIGALLSLSEDGCMIRTNESLIEGAAVNLQFALPDCGLISTRAECRYTQDSNAGLCFTDPPKDLQQTIANYVTMQLATAGERSDPSQISRSA